MDLRCGNNEQSRVQCNGTSVIYINRKLRQLYRPSRTTAHVGYYAYNPGATRLVCRSTLLSHDLCDGSLGDNHDGSLDVAGREIVVDANINNVLQ